MIICIDCAEGALSMQEHYSKHPNVYPIGDCRLCHRRAPLTDGYVKKQPGKYFDTLGNEINIGDIIAYSVAAGRSSGKMIIGKIHKFGKSTVCVEYETVEWDGAITHKSIQTIKTHFNYHPSKCLKLNSSNV